MKYVVFLTPKPYDNYFRKYLIQSMADTGAYEILCVSFLRDEITVYLNGVFSLSYGCRKANFFKLIRCIKDFQKGRKLIIWNALNFGFWKVYLFIRINFPKAFVVYDIFDYFYYDEQSKRRLAMFKIIDLIYQFSANKMVVLSGQLSKIYKKSCRLNNASHLKKEGKKILHNRVGVFCSIDNRFDFYLLEYIAKNIPEVEFAVYGWIRLNREEIQDKVNRLVNGNKNIKYCGEYKNDQLQDLLSAIDIGLVPYKTDSILTKYINPDKYFHCLCFGLEVVSSAIPAAYELEKWIHICVAPGDFVGAIRGVYQNKGLKNSGEFWRENNWEKRLEEAEESLNL